MRPRRDVSIDAIRGLAIVTMAAANLAAKVLPEPYPMWLRVYGSFAAPLFILLAGMMAAWSAMRGERLGRAVRRGAFVIAVGVAIDVGIWQIVPGLTVDVLYLIGCAIPVAHVAARGPVWLPWAGAAVVFGAAAPLQAWLGYAAYPTEIPLLEPVLLSGDGLSAAVLRHWIVDGWFPLVPWLGFALLGAGFGTARPALASSPFASRPVAGVGVLALAAGLALSGFGPGGAAREEFTELFYPPTPGYLLCAVGVVIVVFGLFDRRAGHPATRPLQWLGHAALALYVLHLAVIRLAAVVWTDLSLEGFLAVYVALAAALVAAGHGLERLKVSRPVPPLLRLFIGG